MARIPYFDPEQAPERVLHAMAGKRKINIFRMVANSENSAPEVLALGQTLSKGSSLDPTHREVVILRVAHLTNAAYQWHEHTTVAKRVGFTAEKIDAIVRRHAPMLASKTYYGMPGWARDGKVCVFMQPASKFKVRYCTIGFDPSANLDDGDMWPTSFALLQIGSAEEKKITALVKQAVS